MHVTANPVEVERDATTREIDGIARYLQETLGQRLTVYLAGLNDPKTVGTWGRGENRPQGPASQRLRQAYQATKLLVDAYGAETAQSWWAGTNSYFDGQAPATILREARTPRELSTVVPVALAFVRGGH